MFAGQTAHRRLLIFAALLGLIALVAVVTAPLGRSFAQTGEDDDVAPPSECLPRFSGAAQRGLVLKPHQ